MREKEPQPIRTILGLDFETANGNRSSVCSMGLCSIDTVTGQITGKHHLLINPKQEFKYFNTLIHGITAQMVKDAPTFPVAMASLASFIDEETIVVAHNAPFEISCINRGCEAYGINMPTFKYFCTLALSRSLITGLASYSLPSVGVVCGLPMFNHHRADDDAEACARIFLHFLRNCETTDLQEFSDRSGIVPGGVYESDYARCYAFNDCRRQYTIQGAACPISAKPRAHSTGYFTGKTVVFTGTLLSMTREEAERIVTEMGGIVAASASRKVQYVVCGYVDPVLTRGKEKSAKLARAEQLIQQGYPIQILQESEFYAMLDG